jgi:glucose-6-phosphate 1-dehydrogenase
VKKLLLLFLPLFVSLLKGSLAAAPPAAIVIFGATGDLTARKVLPAIHRLAEEGKLSDNTVVIGVGRRDYTSSKFREMMGEGAFAKKLYYHRLDFDEGEGYEGFKAALEQIERERGTQGNRIFYLATHSNSFAPIIEKLSEHGLIYDGSEEKWSRVILEKPFGHDLDSAIELQREISKHLDESQIYRIDHYLGKAAVQNLLAFRFKNTVFEPLWNKQHIDHVQITISEEIGIGTRAHFWEETGLLRDIFQNHMMQLLSIVAMEPPTPQSAEAVHAEKIKLLKAVRPFPAKTIDCHVVRGQYGPGESKGQTVAGYRQEKGVPEDSNVETFAAAKLFIDNPRWRGVPFYLRSGKRLDAQMAEIVICFKNSPNKLLIRIQPQPGVFLKIAGNGENPAFMGYELDAPEAYEKLILDALVGDQSSFVSAEEQLAAWKIWDPVIEHWKSSKERQIPQYASGSHGPKEAETLIAEDGRKWEERY